MNYIKVISRKIPKYLVTRGELIDFSNRLTEIARKQKGFIQSSSYWNVHHTLIKPPPTEFKLITLSDCESEKDWTDWLKSSKRIKVFGDSNEVVLNTSHIILYKKLPYNDTFLL